jgi:hypothetical protein
MGYPVKENLHGVCTTQVRALAEKYFGGWQAASPVRAAPAAAANVGVAAGAAGYGSPEAGPDAAQALHPAAAAAVNRAGSSGPGMERADAAGAGGGAGRFEMVARAGPAVMQAYHRPSLASPDAVTLDVIRRAAPYRARSGGLYTVRRR